MNMQLIGNFHLKKNRIIMAFTQLVFKVISAETILVFLK